MISLIKLALGAFIIYGIYGETGVYTTVFASLMFVFTELQNFILRETVNFEAARHCNSGSIGD